MKPLSGRTAIITGASQGLGKHLARAFVEAGANLVICARDKSMLKASFEELKILATPTQQLDYVPCDVSQADQVKHLVDFALQKHNRIDILLNNAGVYGPLGCLEEVDWEEWTRALEINLYGPLLLCRALLPHFKLNRCGKIINLSGGGATAPLPHLSAYAASKSALVRLTETLARETSAFGIDVNAIAPGALNTRLLDQVLEAGADRVGADFYRSALKQKDSGGSSLDNASQLCVFLASPESNGITGRLISALWDPWAELPKHLPELESSDIYTLRRIVPADRGVNWDLG